MEENRPVSESTARTAKREVKNSVFIDLFTIPKYQLQLFQSLHPEMTDVTEDDIQPVTINPVLVNMMYNDLGLLVKDRLLIFIEAQSTWSINILLRILMYLAMTYQEYITEREMNVYSATQLEMPKPEFYIVYTGGRSVGKEIISLREDFFRDPEVPVDLAARVIHAENKDDIIGQYIIFCHVIDGQIKEHGRTRKAVENAIRICSDSGVLKEYLNGRKKEVIDVMITLFSQEYAVDAYAKELAREAAKENLAKGLEKGIQATVELSQEYGLDKEQTAKKVAQKFRLTEKEAVEYTEKYWVISE